MEDSKITFQNKFPIDPFRRDKIFVESSHIAKEMTQSLRGMQRKQQFNEKLLQGLNEGEDYNI